MTPTEDRYDLTTRRLAEVVRDLRALQIPSSLVQSISIDHWTSGVVANIHINGATTETVALVDRIADHYALPPDTGASNNYARGGFLGTSPVHVFCGRPKDRGALIREWVAENYGDESKRLVAEGAEATPEDQAKFSAAEAAGLFAESDA